MPEAPLAIEDVSLETYAALTARLDVLAAREPAPDASRPPAGPAARRAELVRAAGWDADHWTRVDRGFRALLTAEASQGALRAAVPIADRFPLLLRYGALYAAAKKGAIAEVAAPEPAAPPAAAPPEAAAGPTSGAPTSAVDASNQAAQQG